MRNEKRNGSEPFGSCGLIFRILLVLASVLLLACTSIAGGDKGSDYLPGGVRFYSYGTAQDKEYFLKNVKRVQDVYALYSSERHWLDAGPNPAISQYNMLQSYSPLHVRWELKDGRQFIAENIDIRAMMQKYFKTHDIKMPWQLEVRQQGIGDSNPSLVYEVRDDEVIVKWVITTNKTPHNERILPSGAATRWTYSYEQHIVGAVKGKPTSGIDFEKRWEFNRNK